MVLAGKAYVVGAPEFVLRQDYAAVQGTIEVFLEKGYRVLVFAEYEGIWMERLTEMQLPLHLSCSTMQFVRGQWIHSVTFQAGVEVKVISGDNPVTVSEIAKKRESACGKTGGRGNVENSGAVRKAAKNTRCR